MNYVLRLIIIVSRTKNKTIVLVASPLGRCGTSAMMGLLYRSGVDIGIVSHLSKPSKMNPKGFFELSTFKKFMLSTFGKYYSRNVSTLDKLICNEFSGNVFAVKAQRYLKIPLINNLSVKYNIKVLCMHRNLKDQVKSIMRMWKGSSHKHYPNNFNGVMHELIRWKKLSEYIQSNYKLSYKKIQFEELINYPLKSSKDIFNFIGIDGMSSNNVLRWIDKKLVNRDNI